MGWDRVEGKWKQFRGRVLERWGELTEDDLDEINGRREQLLGKLQQRYGIIRERAEEQLAEFLGMLEDSVEVTRKGR